MKLIHRDGGGVPLNDVESRWSGLKELSESCGRSLNEMVDDLKEFDNQHGQMTGWLGQKNKMLSLLGPVATDPVMIQNQLQQLEVHSEFHNAGQFCR